VKERLIKQLRDIIIQLDWALTNEKEVQNLYFKRLEQRLEKAWSDYNCKVDEFNQKMHEENAKIANIRTQLSKEKLTTNVKMASKRINELEVQVGKIQAKESLSAQKLSELRTKTSFLEGENRSLKDIVEKNRELQKQLNQKLTRSECQNANLRVKLGDANKKIAAFENKPTEIIQKLPALQIPRGSTLREKNPLTFNCLSGPSYHIRRNNSDSQISHLCNETIVRTQSLISAISDQAKSVHWSSPLALSHKATTLANSANINSDIHSNEELVYVKYELTKRGREHTFRNLSMTTTFTVLNCDCMLYEYSNGDFRWIGRSGQSINVYYYNSRELYEIRTLKQCIIKFFTNGQLEVDWKSTERTIIFPNNKRYEIFQPEGSEILHMDCYENESNTSLVKVTRYGGGTDTVEEFIPREELLNVRSDKSYSHIVNGNLQIAATDFKLCIIDDIGQKQVKIQFIEAGLDIWLCTQNVLQVKHVEKKIDGTKYKRICFSYNSCSHLKQ